MAADDPIDFELDTQGTAVSSLYECDDETDEAKKADATANEANDRLVMNPVTGAVVDLKDIDSVIRAVKECKELKSDLESFDRLIRQTAVGFTKGTAKTRRIQGKTLRAKVEMPDDAFDQSILKEAWHAYPKHREKYLRISRIDPQLREVKKLRELSTDDPAFESFKTMIERANQGPQGMPRVTVEE